MSNNNKKKKRTNNKKLKKGNKKSTTKTKAAATAEGAAASTYSTSDADSLQVTIERTISVRKERMDIEKELKAFDDVRQQKDFHEMGDKDKDLQKIFLEAKRMDLTTEEKALELKYLQIMKGTDHEMKLMQKKTANKSNIEQQQQQHAKKEGTSNSKINRSNNIEKKKTENDDATALQKGVLSQYELPKIQSLYEANPHQLTDEVVIDAIFFGAPGVLTFLATQYKSKLPSNYWDGFVKSIPKQSPERQDKTLTTICQFDGDPLTYGFLHLLSSVQLEEYLNVFPELINCREKDSEYSLSGLEHCFSRNHFTGDKLKALININATTVVVDDDENPKRFLLYPKSLCEKPDIDLDYNRDVMGTDSAEALSLIMTKTKIHHLCISWSDWTREAFDMFIRSLFDDNTTCKRLVWNYPMEPEFAPSIVQDFAASPSEEQQWACPIEAVSAAKDIAASLSEEQMWACPIEEVSVENVYGHEEIIHDFPLVSLLPSMRNLKKLQIIAASHDFEWSILTGVVARGNLVSLRVTFSEDIDNVRHFPVDSIISILEATRKSPSMKEIIIINYAQSDHFYSESDNSKRASIENPQAAEAIGACLCNILKRDNTTLTDVLIDPVREGNLYWEKVKYYCHFNRLGRCRVKWSLSHLVSWLSGVRGACVEDTIVTKDFDDFSHVMISEEKEKWQSRMETSLNYGLLREQPRRWSQNPTSLSTLTHRRNGKEEHVGIESACKEYGYCCNVCGCNARYYCPGCGAIDYCSLHCQKGDWKDHRKSCPQAGAQKCNYCQTKTYGKCSRCSVIPYCGKSCERKDRWIHRFGCQMEQFD